MEVILNNKTNETIHADSQENSLSNHKELNTLTASADSSLMKYNPMKPVVVEDRNFKLDKIKLSELKEKFKREAQELDQNYKAKMQYMHLHRRKHLIKTIRGKNPINYGN